MRGRDADITRIADDLKDGEDGVSITIDVFEFEQFERIIKALAGLDLDYVALNSANADYEASPENILEQLK